MVQFQRRPPFLCSAIRRLRAGGPTVIGETWTKERLLEAAERTIDLERLINARFGLDRSADTLPDRFTRDTVADGPGQGTMVDLDAVLDSYYTSMGWELDDGLPSRQTLRRLGLEWTAAQPAGASV